MNQRTLSLFRELPCRQVKAPTQRTKAQPRPACTMHRPLYRHYALLHLNNPSPLPARPRQAKTWPSRCPETNELQFDSPKAAKAWSEHVHKVWLCRSCFKWHLESYPAEATGKTSGKVLRLVWWLKKRGYPYEHLFRDRDFETQKKEAEAKLRERLRKL